MVPKCAIRDQHTMDRPLALPMSLLQQTNRIVITCAKGVMPFLGEEVSSLGYPVSVDTPSSVETEGTLADAMKLNLFIRTGQRVLLLLREFKAAHPEELYREVSRIPWEDYISEDS